MNDFTQPVPLASENLSYLVEGLTDKLMLLPAAITPAGTVTHAELRTQARTVMRALMDHGVRQHECVGVLLSKGIPMVVAVHGVLAAGGTYVPIAPDLPALRIEYISSDAGMRVMLTSEAYRIGREWPNVLDPSKLLVVEDLLTQYAASPDVAPRAHGDMAYVIFTSGSTGRPKGVMLDHRGPKNTCNDVNTTYGINCTDRVFGISSLGFDLSVYDLFGPPATGGALVYPSAEDLRNPAAWPAQLRAERVTVWNSAPALMQLLLDTADEGERLPELRLVMLSGDWIPPSMPDRIRALAPGAQIVSLGGATEASVWSIWFEIPEPVPTSWSSIPYGHAMANQPWAVLDRESLQPCPIGVPGELHIGGIGLALGYLGDAEKTNASFITLPNTDERLYKTGDLGRWQRDGEIEFMGRIDFQVKIGGQRVELGEIEVALRTMEAVREAIVLALGDRNNQYLAAWIQPMSMSRIPHKDDVKTTLRAQLPHYMVPNVLVFVETFPVTSNGKLDRKALEVPQEEAGGDDEAAAVSEHEAALLALFREFLRPSVGREDNFFEAGGSSLRAMQLAARLRREFGVTVGIGDIVAAPTVAQLAPRLKSVLRPTWSPLVELQRGSGRKPILLVHPAGGQVVHYRSLLPFLPSQQPLLALEAAGLQGETQADSSLEAMAARYMQAIRDAGHAGPYTLGGWSSGGLISFELARQLVASGDEVERLLLIDTPCPYAMPMPSADEILAWFIDDLQLGFDVDALDYAALPPSGSAFDRLDAAVEQLGRHRLSEGLGITELMPMFTVFEAVIHGTANYTVPPALPVKQLDLMRATKAIVREYEHHPSNATEHWGWDGFVVNGTVNTHLVDGTHYTLLGDSTSQRLAHIMCPPGTLSEQVATVAEALPEDANFELLDADTAAKSAHAASLHATPLPQLRSLVPDALQELFVATGLPGVDADTPFEQVGLESVHAVQLRNQLQRFVGSSVSLSITLLFDQPTLRQLCTFVEREQKNASPANLSASALALPLITLAGTSCRFAGRIDTVSSLRTLLVAGHEGAVDCPPDCTTDFFIHGGSLFDFKMFAVSANEAQVMDPQQRHILEKGYEALHTSGFDRSSLGGRTTGVIVGVWCAHFGHAADIAGGASVYNAQNIVMANVCGRVSFTLGLHGPCTTVDTACAGALVASHHAMRALQHAECEEHLVAGVNMIFKEHFANFLGMLSPNRRSYSFDARADGMAHSEGCAAAVLHKSVVLAAHEPELCGSAVQQDGRSASLTAPNGVAQERLLRTVYSGPISPPSLIETQTNGTPLGDSIEVGALVRAVAPVAGAGLLSLCCAKPNVGHADGCSAMPNLQALILALHSDQLTPNAQLRVLNPILVTQVGGTGTQLPTQLAPSWEAARARPAAATRSLGGVSSFGYLTRIERAKRCMTWIDHAWYATWCLRMVRPLLTGSKVRSPIRCYSSPQWLMRHHPLCLHCFLRGAVPSHGERRKLRRACLQQQRGAVASPLN
jgi:amino acid adenylation domain-containing protein